jgi:glycosyltransferase 2 family protein
MSPPPSRSDWRHQAAAALFPTVVRKHGWLAAQVLVSIVLLGFLVRGLDGAALKRLFVELPFWFYALSLGLIVAGQVLYAWRWRLLLVALGVHVPFAVVLRQYFIGILFNNFFPSTIGGDVAKVYLLGRDYGYPSVTASVLLDRLLGLGLLAMLASVTLWTLAMPSPVLTGARLAVSGVAVVWLVLLGVAVVGTGGLPDRVAWMGRGTVVVAERLQQLRFNMTRALARPALLGQAAAVVIGYSLGVAAIYVIFLWLQIGHGPPFAMMLGVVMTTAVLSNVPIAVNGLGVREQLHVLLLVPLGVPQEAAVAISLLLFGHLLVASLVGLVFWIQAPATPPAVPAPLET